MSYVFLLTLIHPIPSHSSDYHFIMTYYWSQKDPRLQSEKLLLNSPGATASSRPSSCSCITLTPTWILSSVADASFPISLTCEGLTLSPQGSAIFHTTDSHSFSPHCYSFTFACLWPSRLERHTEKDNLMLVFVMSALGMVPGTDEEPKRVCRMNGWMSHWMNEYDGAHVWRREGLQSVIAYPVPENLKGTRRDYHAHFTRQKNWGAKEESDLEGKTPGSLTLWQCRQQRQGREKQRLWLSLRRNQWTSPNLAEIGNKADYWFAFFFWKSKRIACNAVLKIIKAEKQTK